MESIFIADDHNLIRKGLIQILKDQYPYVEIREFTNGEDLVSEVAMHECDLVITDIEMPGYDGVKALKKIRSLKPNLPVLILSLHPVELYAMRLFKAGASGYLSKHAASEELIAAVQRILSGKKYISNEVAESMLTIIDTEIQPHEQLSNREFAIFKLMALGRTNSQIAESLDLAPATISAYRTRVLQKLNLHTLTEITRYAMTHHIISELDFQSLH